MTWKAEGRKVGLSREAALCQSRSTVATGLRCVQPPLSGIMPDLNHWSLLAAIFLADMFPYCMSFWNAAWLIMDTCLAIVFILCLGHYRYSQLLCHGKCRRFLTLMPFLFALTFTVD